MATVSVTNINDGDAVTAASINNQINTVVNDYNGNITAANLASNAVTTAKVTAANITAAKLSHGVIYRRQGSTTGDASWYTGGTSNTDTSAKEVFIQVGSAIYPGTGTLTVTFPVTFNQVPLVFAQVTTAVSQNSWVRISAVTATTFSTQVFINNTTTTGDNQTFSWMAVGQ